MGTFPPLRVLEFETAVPPFDPPSDELIHLRTSRFLKALERLEAATSVQALRAGVAALRERIDRRSSALLNGHVPGDSVAVTVASLNQAFSQMVAAQTLERAKYYLDRFAKSITTPKHNAVSDINLNRWKEYDDILTDSLWVVERRDKSGAHSAQYWGNFIPQIPSQMMRRFTKPGEWVLDAFAGSGTTLIEGRRLGRNVIGIELQPEVADRTHELLAAEPNPHHTVTQILAGDSADVDYEAILAAHGQTSAQLVMLHPPYFDIIKFSDDPRDLSNARSVNEFLVMMGNVIDNVAPLLDAGRYLVLVIGDKYAGGRWIPLGFQTMNEVEQRGFLLKSIIVKNFEQTAAKRSHKELWRYRALAGGFYIFKHEYIFVFKKKS